MLLTIRRRSQVSLFLARLGRTKCLYLGRIDEFERKQFLAPHTSGPRDVPRCGALSLLQKDAALQGGSSRNRCRLNLKLCDLRDGDGGFLLPHA